MYLVCDMLYAAYSMPYFILDLPAIYLKPIPSFMMGYNYSDWTHGWMSAFDGFTVFYRFGEHARPPIPASVNKNYSVNPKKRLLIQFTQ